MRIAFCGRMGSGKTTACKYLAERTKVTYADKVTILSFAEPLKKLAKEIWGYENKSQTFNFGGRIVTARELLQELGNKMREIDPDIWLNMMGKRIKYYSSTNYNMFIDDLRFPNEEEMLIKNGFKIVHLFSPEETRLERMFKRDGVYPEKELLHKCGEDTTFNHVSCFINNIGTIPDFNFKLGELLK